MSNEWKELKIDNLPSDILTGDYDFEVKTLEGAWLSKGTRVIIVGLFDHFKCRYRKPESKAPTHEEILKPNLFWQCDNPSYWRRIAGVRTTNCGTQYLIYDGWCNVDYFIGRESAIIPPED